MRYVAVVLLVGITCCVFAVAGLKEPIRKEAQPAYIATELDHIADRFEETGDAAECIGFLRVKAHALRQIK